MLEISYYFTLKSEVLLETRDAKLIVICFRFFACLHRLGNEFHSRLMFKIATNLRNNLTKFSMQY